ncbi:hypothetical protein RRG08_023806 [Elysia crispata]|uniref:Uncharacterized protein n=1 Tax=Elysia crispata TaxID=231223 RepID=A0AAE0ZVK5_9GAST|nr:hypothetical protein RRG08_023806 [Elysia crispata]
MSFLARGCTSATLAALRPYHTILRKDRNYRLVVLANSCRLCGATIPPPAVLTVAVFVLAMNVPFTSVTSVTRKVLDLGAAFLVFIKSQNLCNKDSKSEEDGVEEGREDFKVEFLSQFYRRYLSETTTFFRASLSYSNQRKGRESSGTGLDRPPGTGPVREGRLCDARQASEQAEVTVTLVWRGPQRTSEQIQHPLPARHRSGRGGLHANTSGRDRVSCHRSTHDCTGRHSDLLEWTILKFPPAGLHAI